MVYGLLVNNNHVEQFIYSKENYSNLFFLIASFFLKSKPICLKQNLAPNSVNGNIETLNV